MMLLRSWRVTAVLTVVLLGASACGSPAPIATPEEPAVVTPTPQAVVPTAEESSESAEPVDSVPKPSAAQAVYKDVTDSAGISFVHRELPGRMMPIGAGVVVLDINGDGRDDLYFSNTNGANHLYRNAGNGEFEEMTSSAGVDDPAGEGNGGCAADYNNDGDVDLYVTNFGPSRLFDNSGDGTFEDVTEISGLDDGDLVLRSTGCAWGDYDGDGYVDLVVTRHLNEFNPDLLMKKDFYSSVGGMSLFHNVDGTAFEETTALLGDTSGPADGLDVLYGNIWGAGFQPSWLDYDDDGEVDLLVINDFGQDIQPNVLWRNDGPDGSGGWTFTDVSIDTGIDLPMYGMGLAVGDPNGDGLVDLFVTNIKNNVLFSREATTPTFDDVAKESRATVGMIENLLRVAWGTMFFDYDNDADEDLYVVSGYLGGDPDVIPANPLEQPNVLLRNEGSGTFEDVSDGSGVDDPGVGRGSAYLDYDGCLDVVVGNFGQQARLFRNECAEGNHWLRVHLQGGASGADGLGAKIEVTARGKTQVRKVISGTSFMGQNMLDAHFGIGEAEEIDSVTVHWPSGKVQRITDVEVDGVLTVVEP